MLSLSISEPGRQSMDLSEALHPATPSISDIPSLQVPLKIIHILYIYIYYIYYI